MPGERIEPGYVRSIWELTDWERLYITEGANIELDIFAEPIPPVSLNIFVVVAAEPASLLVVPRITNTRPPLALGSFYRVFYRSHGTSAYLAVRERAANPLPVRNRTSGRRS